MRHDLVSFQNWILVMFVQYHIALYIKKYKILKYQISWISEQLKTYFIKWRG